MSERNRTIHDLSVEATFERILSRCQPLPAQSVALATAAGCVLAEAVIAPHALPPFANAGMDGFAVHVADLADATPQQPVVLPIAGIIQAGDAATTPLVRGTAIRIMTGALLPPGAEAVVPLEDAEALPDARVAFRQPTSPKRHIRPAGEDVPAATVAIPAGKLLRAAEVGLCCAFGITTVTVIPRPTVAIISTGNELLEPHEPLVPGKIRDANSLALAVAVGEYGAQPYVAGIARDTQADLHAKLDSALAAGANLILTSAGASAGDFDVVSALMRAVDRLEVWQVKMKPGRPMLFGTYGGVPLIGLPGNPASALIVAELFVKPAIARLRGLPATLPATVPTILDAPQKGSKRRHYVRAYVSREGNEYYATTRGIGHGSGSLSTLVRGNALLVIPEGSGEVAAGSVVDAILL